MLAGVLRWGRDNRISEAKLTQANLLLDHLSNVIKANLKKARALSFITNIHCRETKDFLSNLLLPVP